jgi:hypothetical protein
MPAIMAGTEILRHFRELLHLLSSSRWGELWDDLNFLVET